MGVSFTFRALHKFTVISRSPALSTGFPLKCIVHTPWSGWKNPCCADFLTCSHPHPPLKRNITFPSCGWGSACSPATTPPCHTAAVVLVTAGGHGLTSLSACNFRDRSTEIGPIVTEPSSSNILSSAFVQLHECTKSAESKWRPFLIMVGVNHGFIADVNQLHNVVKVPV